MFTLCFPLLVTLLFTLLIILLFASCDLLHYCFITACITVCATICITVYVCCVRNERTFPDFRYSLWPHQRNCRFLWRYTQLLIISRYHPPLLPSTSTETGLVRRNSWIGWWCYPTLPHTLRLVGPTAKWYRASYRSLSYVDHFPFLAKFVKRTYAWSRCEPTGV